MFSRQMQCWVFTLICRKQKFSLSLSRPVNREVFIVTVTKYLNVWFLWKENIVKMVSTHSLWKVPWGSPCSDLIWRYMQLTWVDWSVDRLNLSELHGHVFTLPQWEITLQSPSDSCEWQPHVATLSSLDEGRRSRPMPLWQEPQFEKQHND